MTDTADNGSPTPPPKPPWPRLLCAVAGAAAVVALGGLAAGWLQREPTTGRPAERITVPPPPDSREIARRKAPGGALVQYVAKATAAEVLRFYEVRMPGLGWKARDLRLGGGDGSDLAFSRGARCCIIRAAASRAAPGCRVTMMLLDLGAGGAAAPYKEKKP